MYELILIHPVTIFFKAEYSGSVGEYMHKRGTNMDIYVAHNGQGDIGSELHPCSLEGARDLVRKQNQTMRSDITVYLEDGLYRRQTPLMLGPEDSGRNGYKVIWRNKPGARPVLSGGVELAGWTLHDQAKGIWKTDVPAGTDFEQFWIEGQRATRAWSGWNPKGVRSIPAGLKIKHGGPDLAAWKNQSEIIVIKRQGWWHVPSKVVGIVGDTVLIDPVSAATIQVPPSARPIINWMGMFFLNILSKYFQGKFAIENAYELLTTPGSWYLDKAAAVMYYIPRMPTFGPQTRGIYPACQTLIKLDGTLEHPVTHIDIEGLTFSHTGGSKLGVTAGWPTEPTYAVTPPSQACLQVNAVHDIGIRDNLFVHIGSDALHCDLKGERLDISGNGFGDISRAGISLSQTNLTPCDGFANRVHPDNADKFFDGVEVRNNYIRDVGIDDSGNAISYSEFSRNMRFIHNEIRDIPKIGIRTGWRYFGWTGHTGHIEYAWNKITNACTSDVFDFAALNLSCSNEGPSSIHHNFIDGVHGVNVGIYVDVHSRGVTVHQNVIKGALGWLQFVVSTGNEAYQNWSDTRLKGDSSLPDYRFWPSNRMYANHYVPKRASWPEEAREIMAGAGLEQAFGAIKVLIDQALDNDSCERCI